MFADAGAVAFNICAFISTLFLLEFGADTFVKHTAIVATRIGISPVLVALFTAGAEWEEVFFWFSLRSMRASFNCIPIE